jgi:dienelactone hydrolase
MKNILLRLLVIALAVSGLFAGEITIKRWKLLGPFLDGIRELDVDHLTAYGGEEKIIPEDGQVFHSIQPDGGVLKWFEAETNSATVNVKYPNVNWELMDKLYGSARRSAEFTNVGYAYAELKVPTKTRVLVFLQNVKTVWINGLLQEGEFYTYGYDGVPFILEAGSNRILLKYRGNGDTWFSCRFQPVVEDVRFLEDWTAPDIICGQRLGESWIGVPLVNVSEGWLRGLVCTVQADGVFDKSEVPVPPLAPLSVMKLPVPLLQRREVDPGAKAHALGLSVRNGARVLIKTKVNLRVKSVDQPHKITFLSELDRSVQYLGIRYPRDYVPSRPYALLVSLHGSGDEGLIMAEAHDAKDWAFVVAPTDRRPWGLEYHAWGSLDVQEVIDWMRKHFAIDADRIYITGASMGGHGSLYQGLLFPSRFAAVSPEACFPSPLLYYSSLLQKSSVLSAPGIRYMVDRAYADRDTLAFAKNALHLPIILTHGGHDDNVPPFNPRFFVERMTDLGLNITYREVPDRPHFWFEPRTEEGQGSIWGVCIDHPDIMDFLMTKKRAAFPKTVAFCCIDLSANDEYYWVRVLAQDRAVDRTEVRAEIDGPRVRVRSDNVQMMELFLPPELIDGSRVRIDWNGRETDEVIPSDRRVRLGSPPPGPLAKTPTLSGPLRNAFFRPFVLVYGTQGTAVETAILLNNARFFAKRFWNWVNGFTRILADSEVTDDILRDYNLILFGAPGRNSLTARITGQLPIRLEAERVIFDGQALPGRELALALVYPNPLNKSRLLALFAGTTPEMEALSAKIQPIDRRISMPDFIVAGREFDRDGWAGVRALGFFSPAWNLENKDYYLAALFDQ